MKPSVRYVDHRQLVRFVADLFVRSGLIPAHADRVSDCLVSANLRGVDSHGVARVPIYLLRLRKGIVNRAPEIRVEKRSAGVSLVDGDNGMGPVAGLAAVEEAAALSDQTGIAAVAVRNSNHYGIAAYYLLQLLSEARIGMTVTNAPATMAPFGGFQAFFGTNPWAIAAPAGRYPPVVLDMATSVVARGKISLAEQHGEPIPQDWALDPEGRSTTHATAALAGAMLPFAGPKGSGLALFADVFAGVLSGAAFAPHIGDLYRNLQSAQNVGHFFVVINVEAFMPAPLFAERMEQFVEAMKSGSKAEGHDAILLPGEPEHLTSQERLREGIPLTPAVVESLALEAQHAELEMPPLSEQPVRQ